MNKLILTALIAATFLSCNDKVDVGESDQTLDSNSVLYTTQYKINNTDAWRMIVEYRYNNNLKLKKGNVSNEKRSNLSSRFDAALLKAASNVDGSVFYIITAAYVKDPSEPKYNEATKLLKVIIPKTGFAADTAYYLPSNESLCPLPDDCSN